MLSNCQNSMCIRYYTNSPARSNSFQEIRQATQTDDELALLKTHNHDRLACHCKRDSPSPASILDFLWRINHWRWSHSERNLNYHTSKETWSNPKTNPWQPPRTHKMQTACQTSSILARAKWSTRAVYTKLPTMPEAFKIKMEVRWILYIRPRCPNFSLDKTGNWPIPPWGTVISPHCRLHKSISNCEKAYNHDGSSHSQPL